MQALETNKAPVHSLRSFYKQALTYRAMADLLNKETFASRPLRVSIEGNVGCGKSTLIKYFKNFDEIDAKSEPLDEWRNVQGHNLLHLLYADQKRWNFTFQLYVQLSRLNLQTTQSDKKIQLFERSLQNSRHCFVEMAHHRGNLADLEYATLSEWYEWIEKNMDINLDLIVYLRSSPQVVYNRMLQRNRPEESGVSLEYLTDLHQHYEAWLMEGDPASLPAPVLVLDVDQDLQQVTQMYARLQQCLLERRSINKGRFQISLRGDQLCF